MEAGLALSKEALAALRELSLELGIQRSSTDDRKL